MTNNKSSLSGFTIAEIMVVLVLIALLMTMLILAVFRFVEKTKIAALLSDEKTFQQASTHYGSDVGAWPPDVWPQEDPGFLAWDNFRNRTDGQNDDFQPYGGPGSSCHQGADISSCNQGYANMVRKRWNGPYLEKLPPQTPWGGSYDYDYWPTGNSFYNVLKSGLYLTVRPKWNPGPGNHGDSRYSYYNWVVSGDDPNTSVPPAFEVMLQQMGIDVSYYNVTSPNRQVTEVISLF